MSPDEELGQVLSEVAGALRGIGAALTLHPADRPAEVIHAQPEGVGGSVMSLLASESLNWAQDHSDHHIWVAGNFDPHAPHAIAVPIRQVPGHARLVITVFFDSLDDERRAAAEAAYLERRPFAVGYFRLWQQARLQQGDVNALRAVLDRFGTAVMLIRKSGEIAFSNKAAQVLLAEGSGLYERSGRVRARSRMAHVALEHSLNQIIDASEMANETGMASLFTVEREKMSRLLVSVLPVPHPILEQGETAALVFVVDPDIDVRNLVRMACAVLSLTPTETELVALLVSGKTIQEASSVMRIKVETGRSYLKSIFIKTDVRRQVDLVRLVLMSLMRTSEGLIYEVIDLKRLLS